MFDGVGHDAVPGPIEVKNFVGIVAVEQIQRSVPKYLRSRQAQSNLLRASRPWLQHVMAIVVLVNDSTVSNNDWCDSPNTSRVQPPMT